MADLVGVNPSEAALSEQDFMQSNGDEVVDEPGIKFDMKLRNW